MTDSEIIKALECLFGYVDCRECPYSPRYEFPLCQRQVAKDTLDLITRQQAENKRLEKEVNLVSIQFQDLQERYEEAQAEIERLNKVYQANQQLINALNKSYFLAKSEAYKECIEKVRKLAVAMHPCSDELRVFDSDLDNLVKEMVGDDNA